MNPGGFHALMYHEVVPVAEMPPGGREIDVSDGYNDVLPAPLFVETGAFESQMRWLVENGYTTISLSEVREFFAGGWQLPARSVLLTFDDLYQSVSLHVYPLLRDLGLHAVGFVVGGWVFPEARATATTVSRTLSWPELTSMADVFEYAHHSGGLHTRGAGGTAVELADRAAFIADTGTGADRLDQPRVYGYPFGIYSGETVSWLKEAGFDLAFTTDPGYNDARTHPLELHRHGILRETSLEKFADALS